MGVVEFDLTHLPCVPHASAIIFLSVRVQWKVHQDQIYYAFCKLSHICVTNLHCTIPRYSEVEMLPQNVMRALRSAVPIRLVYRLTVIK